MLQLHILSAVQISSLLGQTILSSLVLLKVCFRKLESVVSPLATLTNIVSMME